MSDPRSSLVGSLVVVSAASLFGLLGVISRTAYGLGLSPFGLVAWRAGVGALVIGLAVAWTAFRGARLVGWRSLEPRSRLALAIASFMGATLNTAMFVAFSRVPVAIVLLGFYLYPALVAAGAAVLGWERLDRIRVGALVVALVGMAAVVGSGLPSGAELDLLGVALALSAALSQAVFVLVSRQGYREVPTDQAMTVVLAVSAGIAAALALLVDAPGMLARPLGQPPLLALLIFAGIFAAAIPSFLFLAGIRWVGPVRAGILMLFEPLVGVILAAAFLGEAIGPVQAAGGAAILIAAVLLQRSSATEPILVPAAEPEPEPAG